MAEKQIIKIVVPGDGDYMANTGGGEKAFAPLVKVTRRLRQELAKQVDEVAIAFAKNFAEWRIPGVAVVQLRQKALAKSKRPQSIINRYTCPTIGCASLGELHVSVTPARLHALRDRILKGDSERAIAHISTIEHITPYVCDKHVPGRQLTEAALSHGLRLRLFRHRSQAENFGILQAVKSIVGTSDAEELHYSDSIKIVRVKPTTASTVARLQSFIGTESLVSMPMYTVAEAAAQKVGSLTV